MNRALGRCSLTWVQDGIDTRSFTADISEKAVQKPDEIECCMSGQRPYFNKGNTELRALFEASRENCVVLEALAEELKHRDRPKARDLAVEVGEALVYLRRAGRIPGLSAGCWASPAGSTSTGRRRPSGVPTRARSSSGC